MLSKKFEQKKLALQSQKQKQEKSDRGEAMTAKKKKGLWANIHAKRKRIKAGSNEKMRKPGSKGAPTAKALKQSAKKGKK